VPVEQQIQPEDEAFVHCPISGGSGSGGKLYEVAGSRPVLQSRLEDVSIIGIGYAGRQLRDASSARLKLPSPTLRRSPISLLSLSWQVWLETGQDYQLITELP